MMIEHDVGAATKNTYTVKRVDSDYFERKMAEAKATQD